MKTFIFQYEFPLRQITTFYLVLVRRFKGRGGGSNFLVLPCCNPSSGVSKMGSFVSQRQTVVEIWRDVVDPFGAFSQICRGDPVPNLNLRTFVVIGLTWKLANMRCWAVCGRIFDFSISFHFSGILRSKFRLFRLKFDLFSPLKRQNKLKYRKSGRLLFTGQSDHHTARKREGKLKLETNFTGFPTQICEKARNRVNFIASYLDNSLELRDKWAHFGNTKTRATTYDKTKKFYFLRLDVSLFLP